MERTDKEEHMTDREILEKILHGQEEMRADIACMQVSIAELQDTVERLDSRVTKLNLHVENETDRNICILAENHSMLMDKLTEAIPPVNKEKILDVKVSMLEADFKKVKLELKALKAQKEAAS